MMNDSLLRTQYDTVAMSKQNFQIFNVGVVLGAGVMMRINLSSYYFLVKLDASYHIYHSCQICICYRAIRQMHRFYCPIR